ncbi:MAG: GFA family protein [Pseudomonadota bacterium]
MVDRDDEHAGRCYCGASTVSGRGTPLTVAYCHCTDCRRITGAPVTAFAAWAPDDLTISTSDLVPFRPRPGVERLSCPTCGSPLAARWDYLPGQVYMPVGLFDRAEDLAPVIHAHADAALPWLHITDNLPRSGASARAGLNAMASGDDSA